MKRNTKQHQTTPPCYGKDRHRLLRYSGSVMGLISMAALTVPASAQLNWNLPGNGNWDTTTPNWTPPGPPAPQNWVQGETAHFGGPGGTVTLTVPITASGVYFDANGYAVTGGTLTISGLGEITAANGVTGTVNSALVVTSGFGLDINFGGSTGTVVLNGNSAFTGQTEVYAGSLRVGHNNALGAGGAGNGTVVYSGASLRLTNNVAIGNEALSIAGSGALFGALETDGSNVSIGGPITLTADARIDANLGTLTLGGTVDKTDFTLTANTIGGTINFNGAITGDNDGLFNDDMTFTGGGVANLNAANTYQGKTNINGGTTVNANVLNALPTAFGRSEVTIAGASSLLNLGANQSIASLDGVGLVNLNANTLTIGFGSGLNTSGNAAANFGGVISGAGNLTKDGPSTQILSGANTYSGVTNVNAGILIAANNTALGTTVGPGAVTNVHAGATLALQGDVTIGETITLINNGRLINLAGSNTLTSQLQIAHDIFEIPNSTTAHIGSNAGILVLSGGIEDHVTGGDMNLSVNTEVGELGMVAINSEIGSSVRNLTIGNGTGTGSSNVSFTQSVGLGANNQYSGGTFLNGAIIGVAAGTTQAFSTGVVTVTGDTSVIGGRIFSAGPSAFTIIPAAPDTSLGNNFLLTGGSTLSVGNIALGGVIGGTGSLEVEGLGSVNLTGANTYSGSTTVRGAGTLNLGNTLASTIVDVEVGGTLNTTQANVLSDSAQVTVDGTLDLGGHENIRTLNGASTGIVDTDLFTFGVMEGSYNGNIIGAGGVTKTGIGGILTLNAPLGFTGALNVVEGVVNLGVGGGLATNTITIGANGTLDTGGANQISDLATVTVNGTLGLGGNETFANLLGAASGVVNLGAFDLTLTGGIDFAGRINGTGSVSAGPGDLILRGDNTFTGNLTVLNGSTVTLLGSIDGNAQINTGGALTLGGPERIANGSTVSNNGILTLNGGETLAALNLNGLGVAGQGLLNGLGLVQATTYNLDNGATTALGANLGTGTQNVGSISAGGLPVTQNGDSAAQDVNILGAGTVFNLNGHLTNVGNTAGGSNLTIGAGATMNLRSGMSQLANQINDPACVINLGTLNLNGNETVGNYAASGALGLTAGGQNPSTLTAATYNLYNGASTAAGANLGVGILNIGIDKFGALAAGTVTMNGNSAAEPVTVFNGAVFNLNGLLTDVLNLTINAGGDLNLGSSERINNAAIVNNNGQLTLNGVETITTYNSTGLLNGNGTLIAQTYNLEAGTVIDPNANLGTGDVNVGCNIPGVITINSSVAAEDVTVCTGTTLNFGGTLTGIGNATSNPGDNLTIQSGAIMNLTSANTNQINNTAVVINDGTFNLFGNETIGSFYSTGTLGLSAGAPVPSVLTTQGNTINLLNGHVSLIGTGLAGIGPNPQLISTGTVNINGTANNTANASNATIDVSTGEIRSGTMFLNGLYIRNNSSLDIWNGATLVSGSSNRINDSTTVNIVTGGTWTLNGNDTIGTLNSGGLLNGTGLLTDSSGQYYLTNGAVTAVGANLGAGTLNSSGFVVLNGNTNTSVVNVDSGTLNLNGQILVSSTVNIDPFATLTLGSSERIHDSSTVNLSTNGTLNLGGNELISTLNSNGLIDGSGLLTTSTVYNLMHGTVSDFGANLGTGNLDSSGTVVLNGNTNANTIDIDSGSLTTNGNVQNAAGVITVDAGATWFVNGSYTYDTLRGHGTVDPGGINGNTFVNWNNLRPGTSIGTITINGNYDENGILHGELAPSPTSDTVRVNGTAYFHDGVLRLTAINGLTAEDVLCGERWNVIDAYYIASGWQEITDANNGGPNGVTFASQVLFDMGSGDVVGLGLLAGETIADYPLNMNQHSILDAVFTGAVDGVGNYRSDDGGAGEVLDAIYTFGAPGDKDAMAYAIDALSPEGYAGTVDYALHATRSYAQNIMAATPQMAGRDWELVAGWSHFGLGADSSNNSHDYDLNSNGGYLGLRVNCHPDLVFGGFLAADNGSIDSGRLDLDADGFVLGGFVEWTPQGADGPWNVWGNMAYGSYEFDGHRRSLINRLSVPAFNADAFQLGVGVDYEVYDQGGLRVVPGIGLRYIDASTDSFTESGGADALHVGGLDEDQFLLDLALRLYYQETGRPYAFHGEIGWQHDFSDASRNVSAILANGGGVPFTVEAPGLGEDAFTFGLGAFYDVGERYRVGLSYRGEVRSDSDMFNGIDLRVTAGF